MRSVHLRAWRVNRLRATRPDGDAVPLPPPAQAHPIPPSKAQAATTVDLAVNSLVLGPYRWYASSLDRHPLATKACTSLVGFIIGDLIAQHISHPAFVDTLRVVRLGMYGLLVDGPVGTMWYDLLEAAVLPKEPLSTRAVLAKTFLDQTVYATVMTVVYFAFIKTLEGRPDAIAATLADKFWPTLTANYIVWPLAHLINFRFVPPQYRILYNNVVCIAWLTWLSLLTHTKMPLFFFLTHK